MDSVTCKGCQKPVSKYDLTCPHCGHRVKEKAQWWKNSQVYKITGLVLIGVGVMLGVVQGLVLGIIVFLVGIIFFFGSRFLPQW